MKLRVVYKHIELRDKFNGTKIYREGDEFDGSAAMLEKLRGRVERVQVEEPEPEVTEPKELIGGGQDEAPEKDPNYRLDGLRALADRIGMHYNKQWREKRLKREIEAFAEIEGIDIGDMVLDDVWSDDGDE